MQPEAVILRRYGGSYAHICIGESRTTHAEGIMSRL